MNTPKFVILALGLTISLSLTNYINGMQNNVLTLPQPAAPHDLSEAANTQELEALQKEEEQWQDLARRRAENKRRNYQFFIFIYRKQFNEAVRMLTGKDSTEEPFIVLEPSLNAAIKSDYKPLVHAIFKRPEYCDWTHRALARAALEERIPHLKRLLWQLFIFCKEKGEFKKNYFDNTLAWTQEGCKPYIRDIINSFYYSINWDNIDESIKNIEQSIRLHEAIDTSDNTLLTDCLIHGTPTYAPDEFDELALTKAQRLAHEEKDDLAQKTRRILANNLLIFARYGYTIFDFIKKGNNNISMLLKACPTYLSPAFCDDQGNNILHAILKFGLFDPIKLFEFVKLIIALNPELLLHTNNNKETPVHSAVGYGKHTILRWLVSIEESVNE